MGKCLYAIVKTLGKETPVDGADALPAELRPRVLSRYARGCWGYELSAWNPRLHECNRLLYLTFHSRSLQARRTPTQSQTSHF
jgi:hypothetical protein